MTVLKKVLRDIDNSVLRSILSVSQRFFTTTVPAGSMHWIIPQVLSGKVVTMYVYPTNGNVGLPPGAPVVTNNVFQTITFTLTGNMDFIAREGANFFAGIIANTFVDGRIYRGNENFANGSVLIDSSGNGQNGTAVNISESDLFTLQSNGDYLGVDVAVNGDFATDTGWNKGAGWSIAGGQAEKAAGPASTLNSTAFSVQKSTVYSITLDSGSTDIINLSLGNAFTTVTPIIGSAVFTATSGTVNNVFGFQGGGVYLIKDVKVQQLLERD